MRRLYWEENDNKRTDLKKKKYNDLKFLRNVGGKEARIWKRLPLVRSANY